MYLGLYKAEGELSGSGNLLKKNHSATIKSILDCSQDSVSMQHQSTTFLHVQQNSVDSTSAIPSFNNTASQPGGNATAPPVLTQTNSVKSKMSLFIKKGMESGAVQLKQQQAVGDGGGVAGPELELGASLLSADENSADDDHEKTEETSIKDQIKQEKMVRKIKERIQIREDRERRAWIDQKTFSAKERFNYDKYDQSISRILIRSQPKFIQHKYRIKSMDEIKEQNEIKERKQTALDYAKKELAKREHEINPGGRTKVERICHKDHPIETEF